MNTGFIPGLGLAVGLVFGIGYFVYTTYFKTPTKYQHTYDAYPPSSQTFGAGYDTNSNERRRNRTRSSERRELTNCVICLDAIDQKPVLNLQCGHIFHKHCIEMWQRTSRTCPVCRK